ncbi:FHA domain-containing protein [Dankookia rubra]|nr:FHA domain-containing protein [Dankookia rubra]
MKRWTIGSRKRQQADLRLDDATVSGLHADLVLTDDGRWMIEDRNSTNGTKRCSNGRWFAVKQAYVLPDERLRFGAAETTIRRLLQTPDQGGGKGEADATVVPWRSDLAVGLSKIHDVAEFKRNVLFVLDLIGSPAKHIIHCGVNRRPVNPFSFMVFGGLVYTVITTFGLTISALVKIHNEEYSRIPGMILQSIPQFILFFTLTLIANVVPFFIFRRMTLKKRHFDDFMRLMAVVNGMYWMLLSFIVLFWNEFLISVIRENLTLEKIMEKLQFGAIYNTYILSMVIVFYLGFFAVVAQKHFWNISYWRTLWCCGLTSFAIIGLLALISSPMILLAMAVSAPH